MTSVRDWAALQGAHRLTLEVGRINESAIDLYMRHGFEVVGQTETLGHGLVTDTGEGEGKRRVWQAASSSHGWRTSEFADDEDAATSLNWLTRDYVRTAADHMQRWFDVEHAWPAEWQDALGVGDNIVLVTAAQARALEEEIDAVVTRYQQAGAADPDARRISVWRMLHPLEGQQP